jgi:hypothetical protein
MLFNTASLTSSRKTEALEFLDDGADLAKVSIAIVGRARSMPGEDARVYCIPVLKTEFRVRWIAHIHGLTRDSRASGRTNADIRPRADSDGAFSRMSVASQPRRW